MAALGMNGCTECVWAPLVTWWDAAGPVSWRRVSWQCPAHAAVVVPSLEAVLALAAHESPLLNGPPVDGIVRDGP